MKYRVVLWGIGKVYNRLFHTFKYFELNEEIEIVALTASKLPYAKYIDGYPVKAIDELVHMNFDLIISLSEMREKEIFATAISLGIPEQKLISYRVLELPWFHFNKYINLRNSRISIISNNCWGGVVYNTLALECLSPFKNLYLEDRDYIRMLGNLRYYLNCRLSFEKYAVDVHSRDRYPVMALDDVFIHCNHAGTPEEAMEDWNRRVAKMNWDNIFVEMYTSEKSVAEQFLRMNQFEKKICFVPFCCNDKKELCSLQLQDGQTEFWETVISNARNGNNSIAYKILDLLDGKNDYKR